MSDIQKREELRAYLRSKGGTKTKIPLGIDTENPIIKDILTNNKDSEHPAVAEALMRRERIQRLKDAINKSDWSDLI